MAISFSSDMKASCFLPVTGLMAQLGRRKRDAKARHAIESFCENLFMLVGFADNVRKQVTGGMFVSATSTSTLGLAN